MNTQLEEYKALKQQISNNEKFMFERPLLIVGSALVIASQIESITGLGVLAFSMPVLFLLNFNLSITFMRLNNNARMIAYIQLVHEGERTYKWIGWETAIRKYLEYVDNLENFEKSMDTELKQKKYSDISDYSRIFSFHLIIGITLSCLLVTQSFFGRSSLFPLETFSPILIGPLIIFFIRSTTKYRPKRITNSIEWNRIAWQRILKPLVYKPK